MEDRVADLRLERAAQAYAVRSADQGLALAALAAILGITGAWWALALWPVSADAPEWLVRTRFVCFGNQPDSLPDAGGWSLLIGQPLGMLGFLVVVWGRCVRAGLRTLASVPWGRATLAGCAALLLAALGLAGTRVAFLARQDGWVAVDIAPAAVPASYPRLDRASPPLALVNQHGERFDLASFRGRRVLLTFAYAHCETVCPLVVRNTLEARAVAAGNEPVVVVVTLDPWRDTPERLQSMARQWRLGPRDQVLSGPVEDVRRALAAWNVPIERDERTGEIVHPVLLYVIAADGRIAYVTNGGAGEIAELVQRT